MCMIIGKRPGVAWPSDETLEYIGLANRDGIGIAYTGHGSVFIKKDFDSLDVFKRWAAANISTEQACLIHFRKATAGLVDEGNRHPFPVTRRNKRLRAKTAQCDIAVAHNGTFIDYKNDKKYSDTILFIRNILADPIVKNNLHTDVIQELVKGYIDSSRLALLDRLGNIMTFGTFHTEAGLLYSNLGYKPYSHAAHGGEDYGNWAGNCQPRKQCPECYTWNDWGEMVYTDKKGWMCRDCQKKLTGNRIDGISRESVGLLPNITPINRETVTEREGA